MLEIGCPTCGRRLLLPTEARESDCRCPGCGAEFRPAVPATTAFPETGEEDEDDASAIRLALEKKWGERLARAEDKEQRWARFLRNIWAGGTLITFPFVCATEGPCLALFASVLIGLIIAAIITTLTKWVWPLR